MAVKWCRLLNIRHHIAFIRNFMIAFGPVSSIFDFLTFGVLLFVLHAQGESFRTGWFLESVISASVIVLVIRTRRSFFQSRPGKYLLAATLLIVGVTLVFPFSPLGVLFKFRPLPIPFFIALGAMVVLYIISAEITKRFFYKIIKS